MNTLIASLDTQDPFSPFAIETGIRINHVLEKTFHFNVGEDNNVVEVKYTEPNEYLMRVNRLGPWQKVTGTLKKTDGVLELFSDIDGVITKARTARLDNKLYIFTKVINYVTCLMKIRALCEHKKKCFLAGPRVAAGYSYSEICNCAYEST